MGLTFVAVDQLMYFVLLQAKPDCDEAVVVREDEGGGAGGGDGEDEDQHGEDGMEKSASGQ